MSDPDADPLTFTPEEREAADADAAMMAAAAKANGPDAPSIMDLFPGAKPLGALEAAVSSGRTFRVKQALRDGEPLDGPCGPHATPLHAAAEAGRPEIVRLLLDCGADPLAVDADGRVPADLAEDPDVRSILTGSRPRPGGGGA